MVSRFLKLFVMAVAGGTFALLFAASVGGTSWLARVAAGEPATVRAASSPTATLLADKPQKTEGGIDLLAPLGSQENIPVSGGFGTFITYFNDAGMWLIKVAVGICVIWVLLGGIMVMMSGSNSGLRSTGITHMKWSIMGIVLLLFTGFILRTLNSMFFK
ncbi:MAG: hypothetical protein PHI23_00250 [Candidatus Peribacteraceae bacterium]|nr:hypothetical protein [Candidatus Peribacteraceae bacterium]